MTEPIKYIQFEWPHIVKKLTNREPFAFSRFGDGEFACMVGDDGGNCDGHRYYPELGQRLRRVLIDSPPYYIGLQPKLLTDRGNHVLAWMAANRVDREWVNADIIHDASIDGLFMKDFAGLVVPYKSCLVANATMQVNMFTRYIGIPQHNAWLQYERTKMLAVEEIMRGVNLMFFCAGMMTNVLIHDLWQMFPQVTYINGGSVLAPYYGLNIRRYHSKIIEREKEACSPTCLSNVNLWKQLADREKKI